MAEQQDNGPAEAQAMLDLTKELAERVKAKRAEAAIAGELRQPLAEWYDLTKEVARRQIEAGEE